jgi:hypothetical protein
MIVNNKLQITWGWEVRTLVQVSGQVFSLYRGSSKMTLNFILKFSFLASRPLWLCGRKTPHLLIQHLVNPDLVRICEKKMSQKNHVLTPPSLFYLPKGQFHNKIKVSLNF